MDAAAVHSMVVLALPALTDQMHLVDPTEYM